MILNFKLGLLAGVAAFGLAACSPPQTSEGDPSATLAETSAPSIEPDAAHSRILAAAEPFEALTEQAPLADSQALQALIAEARAAGSRVSADLADPQRGALEANLSEIEKANTQGDRIGIALASVEGYRTLVESAADTGKVPRAVSLLDYAGFRFQANLAASPVRWADANSALSFADDQWGIVEARIHDQQLRADFAQSLQQMHVAAQANDTSAAMRAASHELDLVDSLENYFNRMP